MMATILVVEDDEDLRNVLNVTLRAPGRTLLEAEHGAAALDLIEAEGVPDLILLDMNMPVMNGWRLAEELRARELWHMPVIVITAAHDAARAAQEIGAAGYLGKPFSVRELATLVEQLLSPQARSENRTDEQRRSPSSR
jgi:CheY-like chemotaxis protein